MSSETINNKVNNNDSKLWQLFIALLPTASLIIWEECKKYREKKQLIKILENTRKIIKDACNKLGIKKLTALPTLPKEKKLVDLINFYHENKNIPSDWQEQLKTVLQVKKRLDLMTKLQQTEKKLGKEASKSTKTKATEFNEISWKKLEEKVIEYRIEQWIEEQLEDKKIQENLDIMDLDYRDYGIWDQY